MMTYEITKFATPNRIGWSVPVHVDVLRAAVKRRIEQLQRQAQLDQDAIESAAKEKKRTLRDLQEHKEEELLEMKAFLRLFLLAKPDAMFEVTADDAQFFQLT